MVQVTISVENDLRYTCSQSFLRSEFTNLGSLLFLRHLLESQGTDSKQSLTYIHELLAILVHMLNGVNP